MSSQDTTVWGKHRVALPCEQTPRSQEAPSIYRLLLSCFRCRRVDCSTMFVGEMCPDPGMGTLCNLTWHVNVLL